MIKKFNESSKDDDIGELRDLFQELEYDHDLDVSVDLDVNKLSYNVSIKNIGHFNLKLSNEICDYVHRSLKFGFTFAFIKSPFLKRRVISTIEYRPRRQFIYITQEDSFKSGEKLRWDIGVQMVLLSRVDSITLHLEKKSQFLIDYKYD